MDQEAGNTVVALEPLPARLASTGYWRQLHPLVLKNRRI